MPRVTIIQELLAQYRVPFYEGLREALAREGVVLELVHGKAVGARAQRRDEARIPWAVVIKNRSIWLPGRLSAVWQPSIKQLRNSDLVIVEHANRLLLNYALLARRKLLGNNTRVAFWGHGANLQAANPKSLRERIKTWTARQPDWWFAYTQGSAERVINRGFPRRQITVVQNAIDTSAYRTKPLHRNSSECVFVGGLHEHKRLDFLLDACSHIAQQVPGFRLTIVGDGPLRQKIRDSEAQLPWLSYQGPLFGHDKAEIVSRATLMLMPGLVGLAVLDAFAAQTPLVTTELDYHSPEIEYLAHGENGFILPSSTRAADFGEAVIALLNDPQSLAKMRQACAISAAAYGLDDMIDNFTQGILSALKS